MHAHAHVLLQILGRQYEYYVKYIHPHTRTYMHAHMHGTRKRGCWFCPLVGAPYGPVHALYAPRHESHGRQTCRSGLATPCPRYGTQLVHEDGACTGLAAALHTVRDGVIMRVGWRCLAVSQFRRYMDVSSANPSELRHRNTANGWEGAVGRITESMPSSAVLS